MIMIKKLAAAVLIAVSAVPASYAGIVYTSPDFSNASNPVVNAWCSSCGGSWEVSDVFTLSSAATISGADFAIQASYGSNWNIDIGIWDTALSSQIFSVTMLDGSYTVNALGNDVAMVSASFAVPELAACSYRMCWYDGTSMGVPGYSPGTTLIQSFPHVAGGSPTPRAHVCARAPAAADSALIEINDAGRRSLEELRSLLGLLRSDEVVPLRPVPAATTTLNDVVVAAGHSRRVEVVTNAPGASRPWQANDRVLPVLGPPTRSVLSSQDTHTV